MHSLDRFFFHSTKPANWFSAFASDITKAAISTMRLARHKNRHERNKAIFYCEVELTQLSQISLKQLLPFFPTARDGRGKLWIPAFFSCAQKQQKKSCAEVQKPVRFPHQIICALCFCYHTTVEQVFFHYFRLWHYTNISFLSFLFLRACFAENGKIIHHYYWWLRCCLLLLAEKMICDQFKYDRELILIINRSSAN